MDHGTRAPVWAGWTTARRKYVETADDRERARALSDFVNADSLGTGPGSIAASFGQQTARAVRNAGNAANAGNTANLAPVNVSETEQAPTVNAPAADPNELRSLSGIAAGLDAPPAPPKGAPAPGPKVQAGTDGAAPFTGPELAPPQGPPTGEVLAGLLLPAFAFGAPNWRVTPEECRNLGNAWGAVLDHYWPGGLSAMGPVAAAVLCTAATLGPRVMMKVPPRALPPKVEKPAAVPEKAPEPAQQPEVVAANDPTADGVPRNDAIKYD